jgi:DNA-binding winged helix-turn-helix (wHTH) protein
MEAIPPRRARFGAFDFDVKTGELHRGKRRIVLQEQPFRVLSMLVECAGDVATREEIRNKLWPNDTVVEFDHGINRAIRKLREALGDSAENPKYIETVARRGYRLLPPVEWQSNFAVPPITGGVNLEGLEVDPMRVQYLYTVPLRRNGDKLHITVQLGRTRSNGDLCDSSYERDNSGVPALERDLPQEIHVQIQLNLTTQLQSQLGLRRTVSPEVLEAYLQGRYHLGRFSRYSGDEAKKKAAEYFRQAIEGDPQFAPAYNGLAQAHQDLLLGSSEDVVLARRAAERAIELDPAYSEARVSLAILKWKPDLNWQGAETEFSRAIALNYDNAHAHRTFGVFLNEIGRVDEGLRECQIAQQLSPGNVAWFPYSLFYRRHYDDAITTALLMLRRDPDDAFLHLCLYSAYVKKGMYKEAVEEFEKAATLWGLAEGSGRVHDALASSGPLGAIQQWAVEFERLQTTKQGFLPGNLAKFYAILGDKDRAFYWLEQGFEQREVVGQDGGAFPLKGNPMYDSLRSDPRYKELLRRIRLPA